MAVIGTVVAISGEGAASVVDELGEQKLLKLNDTIQPGDTIITPLGVIVELQLVNGRIIIISAQQTVKFTQELAEVMAPTANESAVDLATVDAVIKAIEEGRDINEVLEETAAGLVGGATSAYGHSFVDLSRIDSVIEGFDFEFSRSSDAQNDINAERDGDVQTAQFATTPSGGTGNTNIAPVATDASESTGENTVLNSQVPAATDIDGTIASYSLVDNVTSGSLKFNADGTYSFDPGTDFDDLADGATRDVTFTYYATDDFGADSGTQTVTIRVTGTNDAPVISDATVALNENIASGTFVININDSVTGTDFDLDGEAITYTITSGNDDGIFEIDSVTGQITIAPGKTLDYETSTQYLLTITASDGVASDTAVITVNVNDIDETIPDITAPIVDGGQSFDYAENQAADSVVATVAASDDVAVVSYRFSNGTQTSSDTYFTINNAGQITITAAGVAAGVAQNDFETGLNSFTYSIEAGDTAGNWSTAVDITLNVTNVNDAPEATDDAGAVVEDATLVVGPASGVLANDSDLENDPMTVTAVNGNPANLGIAVAGTYGTLTLNANGSYTYVANNADSLAEGVKDTDSFTYTVADGNGGTDTASITIIITGTNDTPIFTGVDIGSVTEDVDVTGGNLTTAGTLIVTDPDAGQSGINTSAPVISIGNLGSLVINAAGEWAYSVSNDAVQYLAEGETRDEVFTVTSVDGTTHEITVTITGTQDNPTAEDMTIPIPKNTTYVLGRDDFGILDADSSDALSVTITSLPSDGTLWYFDGADWVAVNISDVIPVDDIDNRQLVFVPLTNDTGSESFTFTVSDGTDTTPPNTMTFSINTELSVSSPVSVDEGRAAIFVVELSDARAVNTNFTLTLGGDATPGDDYSTTMQYRVQDSVTNLYGPWANVSGDVTLLAGQTRLEVRVITISDAIENEIESLSLTATISNYAQTDMANTSATGETVISDLPTLTVSGASYVREGDTFSFYIELSTPKETSTSVTLTFSGVATLGVDYEYSIDGGNTWMSSANAMLSIPADLVYKPTFEVMVRTLNDADIGVDELIRIIATANDAGISNNGIGVIAETLIVEPISAIGNEDTNIVLTPEAGYSYSLLGSPMHGTVSELNGVITYTPNTNYSGSDSFTIIKTNSVGISVNTVVTVGVTPDADAPLVTINVSDLPLNGAATSTNVIVNGDFSSAITTGWLTGATGGGTATIISNVLNVKTGNGQSTHRSYAEQTVNDLTSGQSYTFTVNISSAPTVANGLVRWNGVAIAPTSYTAGVATFTVTAATVNTLRFTSPAIAGSSVNIDNVTLNAVTVIDYTYTVDVTAALVDTDGSETLGNTITITSSNLPAGAVMRLADGTTVVPDTDGSAAYSWTVNRADAIGLQLTVNKSAGTQFTLTATAMSTETVGGDTAQGTATTATITMPATGTNTPNAVPEIDSASVALSNVENTATLNATLGDGENTFSWVSVTDSLPALYANGELITYTFDPDPALEGNQGGTITGSTSQGDVFQLTITYNEVTGEYDVSYVQFASLQGTLIEASGETMATSGGNGDDLVLTFNTGSETFTAVITGENYLDGTSTTINTNNKYIGAANNLMNPGERVTIDFASGGTAVAAMQISFFNFDSSSKSAPDELTIYGTTIDGSIFSYYITNASLSADGKYTILAPQGALIKELIFEAGSQSSFKLGIESVSALQYNGEDAELNITYQLSDADGDSATGTISLTLSSSDAVIGTSGDDVLIGTGFNDLILGGADDDVMTGGLGADVFKWSLADAGTTSDPAQDIITDFDTAAPSAGGDILDLRDLLIGESADAESLDHYLHFEKSGTDTIIHISSTGAFSGGFSAGQTVQTVTLQGVDLVGPGNNDQQIIQSLLDNQKLITD
jgi:large repetitive protein